ncbi:MAG: FIST C-terminal domain-containing protein [Gammaproteobacteria bacterium]|nr:FIST C-terminal domain-containing protein [Gammaproteobacteria bacterium]
MEHFLLAHSTATAAQQAVDECLAQLHPVPAEATLGFIYATDAHAAQLNAILQTLKQRSGVAHWVGTVGTGICCTLQEYLEQPALVLLVTDLPLQHFQLFSSVDQLPQAITHDAVRVAVVHGDPRNGQLPQLVANLPDRLGNGFLIGGLTSASNYYYQIADNLTEGNLSGVIFDEHIPLVTGLTQGVSPFGKTHRLTECDGNIAISIDGRPALDVMKEDIGEVLARDLSRIGGYIFAGFPVQDADTGDYLVRNLLGIDPDSGAIAIGEYLQVGAPIMFCKRDRNSAEEDLRRMVDRVHARASLKIKGGLYFSCLGRGEHMFGQRSREMQLIADRIGDVPLVGFYANGEISGNRLYGYTGILTLFT